MEAIDRIAIRRVTTYLEFASILAAAGRNGTRGVWSRRLQSRLMWRGRGSPLANVRRSAFFVRDLAPSRRNAAAE